jgi:hypothetical protein
MAVHGSRKALGILVGCAVLAAGLTAAAPAEASEVGESKIFGLGPILGEPFGGTGKLWFGPRMAFQFHAAITWWGIHRLALFADIMWHPHIITDNRYFDLLWYVGVGGGAGIRAPWDEYHRHVHEDDWEPDPAIWIRVPFGFPFRFHKVPVEAFVEFGPALIFDWHHHRGEDDADMDVGFRAFVAVGGRWYF